MYLSDYAIANLVKIVTGDGDVGSLYRKGQDLTELFNSFGFRDLYKFHSGGLPMVESVPNRNPSRTEYTNDRLSILNGTPELRSLLTVVVSDAIDIEKCIKAVNSIISPEGYNVSIFDGDVLIEGGQVMVDVKPNNEALFKECESKILKALDEAKLTIYVAVAWITNDKLVSKLKEKLHEEVDVKVIINNDGTNRKHCPDFGDIPVYAKRGTHGGIMHNKFCVIDNQVVLHGSYNWSSNAEFKNDETVTVVKGDLEMATSFSLQFRELLKKSIPFE